MAEWGAEGAARGWCASGQRDASERQQCDDWAICDSRDLSHFLYGSSRHDADYNCPVVTFQANSKGADMPSHFLLLFLKEWI